MTEATGKKTYLTIEQQRDVATWLITNGYVTQDKNTESKEYTYWRVKRVVALEEINKALLDGMPTVTLAHFTSALKFFNTIKSWSGIVIHAPAMEDTVQNDMLTAENKKLRAAFEATDKTLKAREQEIVQLKTKLATASNTERYEEAFKAIFKAIPAEVFNKK